MGSNEVGSVRRCENHLPGQGQTNNNLIVSSILELELWKLAPIRQGLKRSILFCGHRPDTNQTNPTDDAVWGLGFNLSVLGDTQLSPNLQTHTC